MDGPLLTAGLRPADSPQDFGDPSTRYAPCQYDPHHQPCQRFAAMPMQLRGDLFDKAMKLLPYSVSRCLHLRSPFHKKKACSCASFIVEGDLFVCKQATHMTVPPFVLPPLPTPFPQTLCCFCLFCSFLDPLPWPSHKCQGEKEGEGPGD